MKIILYLIIALIISTFLISLIWRFLSLYHSPCPAWLSWLVEVDNPLTKANQSKIIIENLNLKPGMKIIDIGCGPGRLTIPLALTLGAKGEVLAMDIQTAMIDKVKAKANAKNLNNIKFLNAGIGEGKLSANEFDRALLVTVLGEIPNQIAALEEIFNALKPGGVLSITETIFDPHFQSLKKISKLTEQVGFQEKELIGNRLAFTIKFEKPD